MKTTIGQLLNPRRSTYSSIGEIAQCLHLLMRGDAKYRDVGRYGDSGPHEILCSYEGCVNCVNQEWHSSRICSCTGVWGRATSWQENHDDIRDCILGALCDSGGSIDLWKKDHGLCLDTVIKCPVAYQSQESERKSWGEFESLHRYWLGPGTLNSCHRNVNLLAEPQLVIGRGGIFITCQITLKSEIKSYPVCYSRWDACFLLRDNPQFSKPPKWCPQRERFSDFIVRSAAFYKSIKPTTNK